MQKRRKKKKKYPPIDFVFYWVYSSIDEISTGVPQVTECDLCLDSGIVPVRFKDSENRLDVKAMSCGCGDNKYWDLPKYDEDLFPDVEIVDGVKFFKWLWFWI